jgi:acetoin utilization protein AcuB
MEVGCSMIRAGVLPVRDLMARRPVTITPETPIGPAFAVMREHEIRHLPVVDPDGRLVGIVTDRDLRQASLARFHALRERDRDLTVQDVMTCAVITTGPDSPVAHAVAAMFERRIGSLPVVEQGRLVGILTERDLLRGLMKDFPGRAAEIEPFYGSAPPWRAD